MLVARAVLIAATVAMLVCMWMDRPSPPLEYPAVSYCVITYKTAGKDPLGNYHFGWAKGWGPCSLLDRYENI